MQLVNRPALDRPTPAPAPAISASNRSLYQRLKVSLSLNLRRQIFLAVCDDLTVRNWLAARLHAELAQPQNRRSNPSLRSNRSLQSNGHSSLTHPNGSGAELTEPQLVSLWLNLQDPDPIVQVAHWLSQHPMVRPGSRVPGFQMIGVERLTHYPTCTQQLFLNHLQQSDRTIQSLDSPLLLWLTRPWLHAVQQSAPALWNCHTALFEFEGEPSLGAPAAQPHSAGSQTKVQVATQWPVAPSEDLAETLPTTLAADWQTVSEAKEFHSPLDSEAPPKGKILASSRSDDPIEADPTIAEVKSIALPPIDAEFLAARPEVAELIATIEGLHASSLEQADPTELALTYQHLGNVLRDRIEQGDATEATFSLAIQAYEQTLVWSDEAAPWWADVLNDIGNLYWMLARQSSQAERVLPYLEQAVVAYQLATTKSDPATQPQPYAMIQSNLGSVYGDLAQHGDRAQSLQNSALAYEESLRYRSLADDPVRYAATQNNLGTTYWNLAQHQQPIPNLQQAIAAYQQALRYYSPDCEPLHYGMLQNNLGTAFWNLAQHYLKSEPTAIDWLLQATRAYQEALTYRTLEVSPPAHAATQNNLGTAFWNLSNLGETRPGDRHSYLNQAIAAYTTCLSVIQLLPASALSFDPLAAHNHLGLAYHHRGSDAHLSLEPSQRSADLEAALSHQLQALAGWHQTPDLRSAALQAIVQTVKAFYTQFGLKGQNLALSKIPATLLPELMRRL
jgi:tetratricopeptide (TPR) repeat protein